MGKLLTDLSKDYFKVCSDDSITVKPIKLSKVVKTLYMLIMGGAVALLLWYWTQ